MASKLCFPINSFSCNQGYMRNPDMDYYDVVVLVRVRGNE